LITDGQLKEALSRQRTARRGRIGEWLRQLGFTTEKRIALGLAAQCGCPLFPLDGQLGALQHPNLLPMTLLESVRMVPVHYSDRQRLLLLAFADGIDHTALYAIEQMLDCRTAPCIATESALEAALQQVRRNSQCKEVTFDSLRDAREMARTARNYALQLGAREIRLVRAGRLVWVRFEADRVTNDLLFQV
jgi:hypothetical protein